jgi:hypothetical protein
MGGWVGFGLVMFGMNSRYRPRVFDSFVYMLIAVFCYDDK